MNRGFLIDLVNQTALRFLGEFEPLLVVPNCVKVLGKSCFARPEMPYFFFSTRFCGCPHLVFEPPSQLTAIEDSCFASFGLRSIVIPRSVRVLGPKCFWLAPVREFGFEHGSELERIEDYCFRDLNASVRIPARIRFISKTAFWEFPELEMEGADKCSEFAGWSRLLADRGFNWDRHFRADWERPNMDNFERISPVPTTPCCLFIRTKSIGLTWTGINNSLT